jgi:hypothetical protein
MVYEGKHEEKPTCIKRDISPIVTEKASATGQLFQ